MSLEKHTARVHLCHYEEAVLRTCPCCRTGGEPRLALKGIVESDLSPALTGRIPGESSDCPLILGAARLKIWTSLPCPALRLHPSTGREVGRASFQTRLLARASSHMRRAFCCPVVSLSPGARTLQASVVGLKRVTSGPRAEGSQTPGHFLLPACLAAVWGEGRGRRVRVSGRILQRR